MREIKFRAWNGKEMVYGVYIKHGKVWEESSDEMNHEDCVLWIRSGFQRVEPKDVMQFTGLKDKNGKDIYDGDIFDSPSKNKFYVKWWKDGWYYNNVKDEEYHVNGNLSEVAEDWEVIGNIYENPELMKE